MSQGRTVSRRLTRPLAAAACAALLCGAAVTAAPAQAAPGSFGWLWTDTGPAAGYAQANACAVNPADRVVSVGSLPTGSSTSEPFIRELAASRTPWYGATLPGDGTLVAVTIAASGDIFAVGSVVTTGHGRDFLIVQQSGATTTTKVWDGAAHKEDRATALALRADGSLFVTGMSKAADGDFDIVLVKYGPAGDRQWTKHFNGPSDRTDIPFAVKVRGSAVYVVGRTARRGHGDDIVLLRYDAATGKQIWVRYYDDPRHLDDYPSGMVVAGSGIYVAGSGRNGDVDGGDALLLRYAFKGTLQWARYTAGMKGMPDNWTAVATAPDGSIVTTGYVYRKATADDIVTAKYTGAGVRSWEEIFSSAGKQLDSASALAIDGTTGDIYVGGVISSTLTSEDMGAVAYGSSGALLWHTAVDGGASGSDWAMGCAVSSDSVYLVGGVAAAPSGSDFAVVELYK